MLGISLLCISKVCDFCLTNIVFTKMLYPEEESALDIFVFFSNSVTLPSHLTHSSVFHLCPTLSMAWDFVGWWVNESSQRLRVTLLNFFLCRLSFFSRLVGKGVVFGFFSRWGGLGCKGVKAMTCNPCSRPLLS